MGASLRRLDRPYALRLDDEPRIRVAVQRTEPWSPSSAACDGSGGLAELLSCTSEHRVPAHDECARRPPRRAQARVAGRLEAERLKRCLAALVLLVAEAVRAHATGLGELKR